MTPYTAPYLVDGSEIAEKNTEIPVSTTELLTNTDNLVNSVPQDDLRTATSESGAAFKGTGRDLGQIIDTSNAFIKTANANFDTTSALIRDSKVVLQTQVDKESAIRSFSQDLALFSGTLAGNDAALRKLIDNGGATANQLRTFLEDNGVELGSLIRNLVTTGQVVVKHLDGIRQVLVLYPYVVEGGFSTVGKGPGRQVRRRVRPGPHAGPARLPQGLREHQGALAPGPRRHPDEREGALRRAPAHVQRPRFPERRRTVPRRRTALLWWPRTMRLRARSPGPTRTRRRASATPVARSTASAGTRGSRCCSNPWRQRSSRSEHHPR